jgi:uncharacterized damage-inducible protein DinB
MMEREQATTRDRAGVHEHLDRLAAFPDELRDLLDRQPAEAMTFRPAEDDWSINEILGHLIVFDARWGNRIRQVLSAGEVRFVRMDPHDAVQQFGFQDQQAGDLLAGFADRRAERVAFLRHIDGEDLVRSGTHPEQGTVSIAAAIATLVENDARRRAQVEANLRAYREGRAGSQPGA